MIRHKLGSEQDITQRLALSLIKALIPTFPEHLMNNVAWTGRNPTLNEKGEVVDWVELSNPEATLALTFMQIHT
jgi:hypothetical protein